MTEPLAEPLVTIVVPGEPKSKARPRFTTRNGKVIAYTPKDTKTAEARYRIAYLQEMRRINRDKEGAYAVHADFYNSTYQRRDVDNLLKAVLDGLNKIAWDDDTQVIEVIGRKHFVSKEEARSEVRIYAQGTLRETNISCAYCGKPVRVYPSTADQTSHCSSTCYEATKKARRMRTCAHCGGTFEAHSPRSESKYCSKECSYEGRRELVQCAHCAGEFTIQRCHVRANNYCSKECRNAVEAAKKRGNRRYRGTCSICGGGTSRKEYTRCNACKTAQEGVIGRPGRRTITPRVKP